MSNRAVRILGEFCNDTTKNVCCLTQDIDRAYIIKPADCLMLTHSLILFLGDTADMTNDNFPIDDVYISGILREKSGLEIIKPDRNNHLVTVIDQKSLNNTSTIADNIL